MIEDFLKDYLSIIIFIFIALALSIGFIILNFLFSPKNPDPEKLSAYECGFEAFGDSRYWWLNFNKTEVLLLFL